MTVAPHRISVAVVFVAVVVATLTKQDFLNRVLFIMAAAGICITVVVVYERFIRAKKS